jgi:hypothetical protein
MGSLWLHLACSKSVVGLISENRCPASELGHQPVYQLAPIDRHLSMRGRGPSLRARPLYRGAGCSELPAAIDYHL